MIPFIKIAVLSILEVAFTYFLFYANKKNNYEQKIGKIKWQILVGIIYGVIAVLGTEFGVQYNGYVVHIRDAAPLIAGLYFSPLSGIIAGLIGGIERWLAVYWGVGEFTRLACTLGTLFAGFFGAFLKKYVLEGKTPGWIYSLTVGAVTEVFHLILVFSTNTNEIQKSLSIILIIGPVMIPMVAITVAGVAFISSLQNSNKEKAKKTIAEDIQKMLFISVIIAFAIAVAYVASSQNHLAYATADNVLNQSIEDVYYDAANSGLSGDELEKYIRKDTEHWHIGTTGYFMTIRKGSDDIMITSDLEDKTPFEKKGSYYYSRMLSKYQERKLYFFDNDGYSAYFKYVKIDEFVIIGVYPANEANLGKVFSVTITAFILVLVLAFLFMQIYFLIRMVVVRNIQKINKSLALISSGNLDEIIDVRTNEEFTSLSDDINYTVDALKTYIHDAEKRIDKELDFARDIQASSLPTSFPVNKYYDIYGNMIAARSVGGDFYDFYQLPDEKLGVLIADVSGKGIPAALFMMKAKTLIKSLAESGISPAEIFSRANDELCLDDTAGMFVTAWIGILDCKNGKLVYSNAGHNSPIIARNDGEVTYLKDKHCLVLAAIEGSAYRNEELQMNKGDGLILYTDGVTEATNKKLEMYGEERLLEVVDKTNAVNMRYLCKVIKGDVDEFADGSPQFDDITLLALKIKDDRDCIGIITTDVKKDSMMTLMDFVDKFCDENYVNTKLRRRMLVVIDEIYSNIINYSHATKCTVTLQERKGTISMSFEDDGIFYNPLEKEAPDTTLSADERDIGGLGVFMVMNMAEDVRYGRINACNCLDIILN